MATSDEVTSAGQGAGPAVGSRWAWAICWLMFLATMLNYMDRQAMALVGPQIKEAFGLEFEDFGWVLAAFALTYAVFQVPAGYIADRRDVRRTYAGAVIWWSFAGMAVAFAPGVGVLMLLRAMLGVGESFNWPCALRVTGRILPPEARGLGNGIFNSGAAVGAIVTPLIVPILAEQFGWRSAFVFIGSLGLVWVIAWTWAVGGSRAALFDRGSRSQADQPARRGLPGSTIAAFAAVVLAGVLLAFSAIWLGRGVIWWGASLAMIGLLVVARLLPMSAMAGADWAEGLGEVVRARRFWVLAAVSISINVCWHFLVNWLPTYLKEDRDMGLFTRLVADAAQSVGMDNSDPKYLASGALTALTFVAADIGNLGGGTLSLGLARRGLRPVRSRKVVMAGCTLLISAGAWVGLVQSDLVVIGLLSLMAFGTAAFMANYFAFCQEVIPRRTGLVVGILGGLGNLFVAGFLPEAGKIKDVTGGFGPAFVIVGLLPFVGLITLLLGWGREPFDPSGKASDGSAST